MITCLNVDSQRKQFCFENFPNTPLDYQETVPSMDSDLVRFQITDKETGKVFSIFMKGTELQRIGISLTTWKKLASRPEKLPGLIKNTATIDQMLRRAAAVASEHLSNQFLTFFTDCRTFANRVISSSIYQGVEHLSGIQGVPGMYFHSRKSSTDVFINLKKTPPLGAGAYGKVRKVLWLSAPSQSSMLAVKKVFKNQAVEHHFLHFKREVLTLRDLSNKRGIISLIAGEIYDNKCAMFLPIYECDLKSYVMTRPFLLTDGETLSMISQWLEGLATISEKGVHGDISLRNLLLKRVGGGKVEAVISDFGTFRPIGQEEHGLTTIDVCSPEYFAKKMVTLKQDVWSVGLALHEIFSKQRLPCWQFDEKEMAQWTSKLSPGWILQCPTNPKTPQFLLDLINVMLDPRHDHRPSAKEVFEQFSKGLDSYNDATSQEAAPTTETTDVQ